MKFKLLFFLLLTLLSCEKKTEKVISQKDSTPVKEYEKNSSFNGYWYDGTAEVTSYALSQTRYGENRKGTAVTIFVTEDFLPEKQVKADYQNERNIPVLKLNKTKKFITGIYPYSIMTSTFSPIKKKNKALKISFSSQEWCGNTFAQLNNREKFEIDFHSYFESNSDKKLSLEKNLLEDELWTMLRMSPKNLPLGEHSVIPSFEYLSLHHKPIKPYTAILSIEKSIKNLIYSIRYPTLKRELKITFLKDFPFSIEEWEERFFKNGKQQLTTAKKLERIKTKYWNKNSTKDTILRKKLNL